MENTAAVGWGGLPSAAPIAAGTGRTAEGRIRTGPMSGYGTSAHVRRLRSETMSPARLARRLPDGAFGVPRGKVFKIASFQLFPARNSFGCMHQRVFAQETDMAICDSPLPAPSKQLKTCDFEHFGPEKETAAARPSASRRMACAPPAAKAERRCRKGRGVQRRRAGGRSMRGFALFGYAMTPWARSSSATAGKGSGSGASGV